MMKTFARAATLAAALMSSTTVFATDLEVTHWWTSGGEAAAVAELAKAFDATGDHWVDGAIAGSSDVARPLIISRILGRNPMGATQLNTGRDAEDLIKAGLMTDLTELATKEKWAEIIRPAKLLDSCMYEGKVYCVPINIHSGQWMWLNRKVFEENGMEVPTDWNGLVAVAPKLKELGIQPLSAAQGWPINTLAGDIMLGVAGVDDWLAVNRDKNADVARGDSYTAVFKALGEARSLIDPNAMVGQWNEAVALVINGKAAANVMGDWAQGEFQVAGQTAGTDYDCLPGLGFFPVLDTGGDSFFFPKNDDPAITEAQLKLASLLISPDVQVDFNLKKGSLPVRGDVNLDDANTCMKKGLEILSDPKNILPSGEQLLSSDVQGQVQDLIVEFFANPDMTPEDAQAQYADIIASAD